MTDANKIHDILEDNSSNTFVSAVRKNAHRPKEIPPREEYS